MSKIGYYFERAKMEEMAARYEALGYSVQREPRIGKSRFDLIATKQGEKLFFEFIYRPEAQEKIERLSLLRMVAEKHGSTDFKVILFDSPRKIEIEIDGLESALSEALAFDDAQSQIDSLGNGAMFEGVYIGDISHLLIDDDGIHIRGVAEVDVAVSYGPSREGESFHENFPFAYELTLNADRSLNDLHTISIDTSSFYGRDEGDENDNRSDDKGDGGNIDDKGEF